MHDIPEPHPGLKRGNAFSHWLGRRLLALWGWRVEGEFPKTSKCVLIAAPHTSNWDFVIGMSAMLATGLRASWMGKNQIFFWPVKYLWQWLGGIATVRDQHLGAVNQRVALFERHEHLILALTPEGTRKKVDKWKTGFYRIAQQAQVPIFPIYWDYKRRVITLAPLFHPSGDMQGDIQALRDLFKERAVARYPEYAD